MFEYPRAAPDKTAEFELKSSLLHHIPKYHGLSMENPNKHLQEFEVVCSSMTPVNVDESILKMKAFPFSLLEKAKDWLYELAPGTVTSWESMKRAFLEKFFPTSRVILLRKRISGIQQDEGESFPTYYERFKSLVASCPQHQMKEELLLQYFYEGLLPIERQMLDASAGGALVDKTPTAAKMLIANRALNAQQYEGVGQRSMPRQHQVNEILDYHSNLCYFVSDLGASINVMPYSVYASMNLGKLKNDGVIIQLADRSNAYPKGVLEDVLVQVDHLIFPADFYVLDMEDSTHSPPSPLLLGRPFMKTAQTKIDVAKGAVTMAFGGDMINFKISESVENTNDVRSCCAINVIKNIGQECSTLVNKNVPQPTIEEGIGVNNTECTAPTLKSPNLVECTPCAYVHSATTSLPYKGLETKYAKKCKMEHFRAKLSWNGVYANGAPGMDEFEGQRSLRNEEMKVKNKEFRFGNQSF
ncbi:unnamed protein product [Malus baccata var. baccata]